MKIFLAGGTGMVGRNFLEHQSAGRHSVSAPGRAELDLLDAEAVRSALAALRPDIVVHAAGLVGGIQANMARQSAFFDENLRMGRNLLLAARAAGVPRFLNIGSGCMYPRQAANPITEDSILTGTPEPTNEGFALAKIAVHRLGVFLSRESAAFSCRTIVPCAIYGRWDHFEPERSHLVPAVLGKLRLAGEKGEDSVEIWGDGKAVREFMYAGDMADLLWRAAENFDSLPELMNAGPGEGVTVNGLYSAAAAAAGYRGAFRHDLSRPAGMPAKVLDVSRMRAWGWTPSTSLADGLAKALAFLAERGGGA